VEEIIERKVRKPVKRTVRREVEVEVINEREHVVEKPIYVDKEVEVIVNKPVPVDKVIEVEKVVDVIEEIQVPTKREVVVEKEVEVEQEVIRKVPKYVEKPYQKVVDKVVEKPITIYVEEEVVRTVMVDKKVPKIVEKEVIVEIPIDREVEKIVEVEKVVEVPVYVDKVVKKEKPKIIEKYVEVKVPKHKQVMVEREVEKLVEQIVEVENPVYVNNEEHEINNIVDTRKNERLRKSYRENMNKISRLQNELQTLEIKFKNSHKKERTVSSMNTETKTLFVGKEENERLRREFDSLHRKYTSINESEQKERHLSTIRNTELKRSVRKSTMPMEAKKSVMYHETDKKKYYILNDYGKKVEVSYEEYIRMKSSSKNKHKVLKSKVSKKVRKSLSSISSSSSSCSSKSSRSKSYLIGEGRGSKVKMSYSNANLHSSHQLANSLSKNSYNKKLLRTYKDPSSKKKKISKNVSSLNHTTGTSGFNEIKTTSRTNGHVLYTSETPHVINKTSGGYSTSGMRQMSTSSSIRKSYENTSSFGTRSKTVSNGRYFSSNDGKQNYVNVTRNKSVRTGSMSSRGLLAKIPEVY
jgi:hypothetical protein